MKLFNFSLILIVALTLLGCSSSTETAKVSETTNVSDTSPKLISSNNIKIKIPPDWKEIADNHEQLFEIWLINKLENAVIAFIPINLINYTLDTTSEQSEFETIIHIILTKKQNSGLDFEMIDEKIIPSEFENKSIKYLLDEQYQNSILFGYGSKYYECLAYFHEEYLPTEDEIEELFATQQEIIKNVVFK